MLLAVAIILVVMVLGISVVLYAEQRDKERRKAHGLPQKKYHDITDENIITVYSIHHK